MLAYREHIEKRIRAGNDPSDELNDMNARHRVSAQNRLFRFAAGCAILSLAMIGLIACQATEAISGNAVVSTVRVNETNDGEMGILPAQATVFDEGFPGINRLAPDLRNALEQATHAAQAEGVEIFVNSGWRSSALQAQLLTDAISEYGSREEAARWVATPETSAHVSGDAVDVGDMDAYLWLQGRGSAYGLCQIYANESWHFEYRPNAPFEGCPDQYLDPTHDPRLQS